MTVAPDPVAFADALRTAGLSISVDRSLTFFGALGALPRGRPAEIYWAGRSTLLSRPEERAVFDRVFAEFFMGADPPQRPLVVERAAEIGFDEPSEAEGDEPDAGDEPPEPDREVRWSAAEALRHRDFAELTEEETEELWRSASILATMSDHTTSRRREPGDGDAIDVRRSVRNAVRRDGEILELRRRRRSTKDRRIVMLVDVSGSMEHYARALVRFAHAATLARGRVEVFALGTRLTRLTRELQTRDPSVALTEAAAAVPDWSGGTRLGAGIGRFLDEWGQRGMARGATVVVLSDGWDRGEPEEMTEHMARLRRLADRIVWVNPLRASPGYAPLARGMAAALPYCDHFVDGHSLASLEELAGLLAEPSGGRGHPADVG